MVSASQQLIYMVGVGARRGILTQHREVSSNLAVEQGHLLQLRARKLAKPALVRLGKQRASRSQCGRRFANPLIGENVRHGPEFRSA